MCCFSVDVFFSALTAFGTIGAVAVSLHLLPPKSSKISGTYWFDKGDGKTRKICIHLTNKSHWFDNTFCPKQGALVIADNDSRYLTLNADRDEFIISENTSRLVKIKTPATAEAMRFYDQHNDNDLYVFMIDGQRIKLTYTPNKNKQKEIK